MKHIVNVSGGMASAVALFRVIERFGGAVHLLLHWDAFLRLPPHSLAHA